jgi:hypothetical protein
VIVTTVLFLGLVAFLGVVMIACFIGVAVIPRFDRRAPLTQPLERIRPR